MADIGMPVGADLTGRAYDDNNLLRVASAFESTGGSARSPPRTPPLGELVLWVEISRVRPI